MSPRSSSASETERVLSGLKAQLDRTERFASTINPAASISTYRRLLDLLQPQLEELRTAAGLPATPKTLAGWRYRNDLRRRRRIPVPQGKVFTYWDKPLDTAPPLVQACVAQMRRIYPEVRVLDGAGVRELIEVPQRIADLLETDRPAHFSDYVRTRILEEHGGIWLDATAWVDEDLDDHLARKYLRGGTLFPRWTPTSIANWFIASQPRTPLISLQRLGLEAWWEANDDLPDYFLYHRIFEIMQWLVPEARGQWDATPTLSASATHLLQLQMMQPYRERTVRQMLRVMPLQKLSYKYDEVPEGSVLEHLLDGRLGAER